MSKYKHITPEDAKLSPYKADPVKYLTDNEAIKDYLKYTLEYGDIIDLKMALEDIAKAKGSPLLAHSTIMEVFKSLGLTLKVAKAS